MEPEDVWLTPTETTEQPPVNAVEAEAPIAEAVTPQAEAVVETPIAEAQVADTPIEAKTIDYKALSDGLAEDEAGFKELIKKGKDYDAIKANQAEFADDFERKRNELKLNGVTKEGLKQWEKLHDLDLDKLSPAELELNRLMIERKDVPKAILEKRIAEKFKLDEDLFSDEDRERANEDYIYEVGEKDKNYLREQLVSIEDTKLEAPIANNDAEVVEKANFDKTLETVTKEISQTLKSVAIKIDNGKGTDADNYVVNVPNEHLAELSKSVAFALTKSGDNTDLNTAEGRALIAEIATDIHLVNNKTQIFTDFKNKVEKAMLEKFNNTDHSNKGGDATGISEAEAMAGRLDNAWG